MFQLASEHEVEVLLRGNIFSYYKLISLNVSACMQGQRKDFSLGQH
jgi:hypothetical protein